MGNSQTKSRRLAARVIEVVPRQVEANPQLDPFRPALMAAATSLIARYDERANSDKLRQRLSRQAGDALEQLRARMASWAPAVNYTLERGGVGPGLDARVPDDLLAEADRLLELARQGQGAGTMAFAATLIAELEPSLQTARELRGTFVAAQLARQAQGDAVRQSATAFDRELVAFRRALRAVVGPSHLDYRRLRAIRGGAVAEPVSVAPDEVGADNDNVVGGSTEAAA